jgi:hypothetical protein
MPPVPRPTPYVNDPATVELRGIRHAMGLTAVSFARLLGCGTVNLANIEKGRQRVKPTLLRLARYLAHDHSLVPVPKPVPPPGPESVGLRLTPASRCDWQEARCRGPWWHVEARLNPFTHVECTCCDLHLKIVYDLVVERLRRRDARRAQQGDTPRQWRTHSKARAENARRTKVRAAARA